MTANREELTALIAFSRLRRPDRIQKRQLLDALPSIASLFEGRVRLHDEAARQEISTFKGFDGIARELDRLEKTGVRVVTIKDEDYPASLRNTPDPPLVLYKKGSLSTEGDTIAIVGSRRATDEGMNLSERIADTLSALGVTVVSGLARGIDASAHRGALKGRGKTVAVLGCGLDICYPRENRKFIRESG